MASAQSTSYALDVRSGNSFTSDTVDLLGNYPVIGGNAEPVFAIDFDATGTTNLTAGLGPTGLTSAIDGQTWYLSVYDAALGRSFLYSGDVTAGSFTPVGLIIGALVIDISIDSANNTYAHNVSTDMLMSVDTSTGLGTVIGPTGLAASFAQGMDFDGSNDTLCAAIWTGTGTGTVLRARHQLLKRQQKNSLPLSVTIDRGVAPARRVACPSTAHTCAELAGT